MSLDLSGADTVVAAGTVAIDVGSEHPLIKLANALPWMVLITMVLPDLKRTTARGFWWTGRKLRVRVHLATYILQKLYNLTDRQTEYAVKDNAAYQLFTGRDIVPGWRPPDHTKLEEFRSRLSPETQRALANEMAKVAVADVLHQAVDTAIQLNGARGYSKDTPLEWIYRYARQARLVDGASEVHKMVLARLFMQERSEFWSWK